MSIVATKKLLFLLADDQNRTYYVENGVVKKSGSTDRCQICTAPAERLA